MLTLKLHFPLLPAYNHFTSDYITSRQQRLAGPVEALLGGLGEGLRELKERRADFLRVQCHHAAARAISAALARAAACLRSTLASMAARTADASADAADATADATAAPLSPPPPPPLAVFQWRRL